MEGKVLSAAQRNLVQNIFLLSVFLLLVFLLLSPNLKADTKNFYFPELKADIFVQKDGSFELVEALTFEFQGQFSWASLWIPRSARKNSRLLVEIENFQVRDERGQPLPLEVKDEKGLYQARWKFAASNERKTFYLSYRVRNAIFSYPEVSELYWQVIGPEVDRPTGRAEITVHLPEPVRSLEEILVYGHGPLSGRSEIVDLQTVRFKAENIPARQFLEIRVVWPAGMVEGVPASSLTAEAIKNEEARYVQQTIELAQEARKVEARRLELLKKIGLSWIFWQIIGPLLWLLVYFYVWKKFGRDYRFESIPEYFREMPSDLPPALVQVLRREGGRVLPVAFTATIFDLATRGYLRIENEKVEKRSLFGSRVKEDTVFYLEKAYNQDKNLRSWEKIVLDWLFRTVANLCEPGSRVSLEELVSFLKKKPASFQEWFRKWQKEVNLEAQKLGFIEPASQKVYRVMLVISLILASLTFSPVLFVLALTLSPRLRRRRKDWARENEMWKALERYLDDFSSFEEIPAEAYKLWDRYLVFAILFGQAKKLVKVLPTIVQNEKANCPAWVAGSLAASRLGGQMEALAATINSIEKAATILSQASTSAAHYSSGSGGGFSSGGGGGGGGGGVSAG